MEVPFFIMMWVIAGIAVWRVVDGFRGRAGVRRAGRHVGPAGPGGGAFIVRQEPHPPYGQVDETQGPDLHRLAMLGVPIPGLYNPNDAGHWKDPALPPHPRDTVSWD